MIGIIGAMDEEIRPILEKITSRKSFQFGSFGFTQGKMAGKDVVLGQSGIGKVSGGLSTGLLLERFDVDVVINTGSAGGIGPGQNVGDLVVSSVVLQHDVDVRAFGYEAGQFPGLPQSFVADENLVALASQAFANIAPQGELAEHQLWEGPIATGDQFISQEAQLKKIRSTFPGTQAVEMEAGAVGQVCHLWKTPFVVLRALSDIAGESSPVDFKDFIHYAARNFSLLVEEMVRIR